MKLCGSKLATNRLYNLVPNCILCSLSHDLVFQIRVPGIGLCPPLYLGDLPEGVKKRAVPRRLEVNSIPEKVAHEHEDAEQVSEQLRNQID